MASVKRSYKAQYQGKEKGEDKRKDGKITSKRKRGRQKKRWEDNIKEWTGLDFNNSQRAAEDRQIWKKIVADVSSGAPTTLMVPGHR